MNQLAMLRDEIDKVDEEIVKLFEKRMELVADVVDYKIENNIAILNNTREAQVIRKNIDHLKDIGLSTYLEEFYLQLMDLSKKYQKAISDKANSLE